MAVREANGCNGDKSLTDSNEVTERCVRRSSRTAVRLLEGALLDYVDNRAGISRITRESAQRFSDWYRI